MDKEIKPTILPCPVDTGDGSHNVYLWLGESHMDMTDVRCSCGLRGPERFISSDAVAAWNRRPLIRGDLPGVTGLPEGCPETAHYSGGFINLTPETAKGWKSIPVEIHPVGTRARLAPSPQGVAITDAEREEARIRRIANAIKLNNQAISKARRGQ